MFAFENQNVLYIRQYKYGETWWLSVTGNPGVIEYYDCFMKRLFEKHNEKIPVWGISHAGHVQPPTGNQALFSK